MYVLGGLIFSEIGKKLLKVVAMRKLWSIIIYQSESKVCFGIIPGTSIY